MDGRYRQSTPQEELINAVTHGVGALASTAGGSVLVTLAVLFGDTWQIVSTAIYSAALLLLYTSSTLFHAIQHQVAKARLQVLDHCAIFVLIAGTYTPFTLVSLRETWGLMLFGIVWVLALAGVIFKLLCLGRFPRLSLAIYLGMGWLALIALDPLLQVLSTEALLWLLAGGLAYTVGTIFYYNQHIPYAHGIWHLFVLAGSFCHFVAVATEVI